MAEDRKSNQEASHSIKALAWTSLETMAEAPGTAALALADGLGRVYSNGRSEVASFLLGPEIAVAEVTRPPALTSDAFWRRMLLLPAVVSALQQPETNGNWLDSVTCDPLPAEELAADLAATMAAGGAYRSTALPTDEAQELAGAFAAELLDGRADTVCRTRQAWSNWFEGALWDRTWLGFDGALNRFWVVRATDID